MLRPEQLCEADINYTTIQKGTSRTVYDLDGRKHDLGPTVEEKPGIEEVLIECTRCPFSPTTKTAEGGAPHGAYNAIRHEAKLFLEGNCEKWRSLKRSGLREMPREIHPKLGS